MNYFSLAVGNVVNFRKYFMLILEEVTAQVSESSCPILTVVLGEVWQLMFALTARLGFLKARFVIDLTNLKC